MIPESLFTFLFARFRNFVEVSFISPDFPLSIIFREFFMAVRGVLNSWDTIEINSDLSCSNFSSFLFVLVISSYKRALSRGSDTCFTRVWKQVKSSLVSLSSLKTSIRPKNLSEVFIGQKRVS